MDKDQWGKTKDESIKVGHLAKMAMNAYITSVHANKIFKF